MPFVFKEKNLETINQTRIGAPDVGGGLFNAPLGTALPTDASTKLAEAFKIVGLLSSDGLSESPNRESDDKKAWGGKLARVIQTEHDLTVKFTLIERTEQTLKLVHGDSNVISSNQEAKGDAPAGKLQTILKNAKVLPPKSFVANMRDGITQLRNVYPAAQVVNVGESKWVHDDLIAYEVELKCYEDSSGNKGYEYEFTPTV